MTRATTKAKSKAPAGLTGGEVMTLQEAAEYLRVSEEDVVRSVRSQNLPGRQVGAEWRFSKSALEQWLRTPPATSGKEALLSVAGAWKDFDDTDEMLKEIYERRGRPMTEGGE